MIDKILFLATIKKLMYNYISFFICRGEHCSSVNSTKIALQFPKEAILVAEVIIDSNVRKLNKTFDYNIPENLQIQIGSRVIVPFGVGQNRQDIEGIVVNIKESSEFKLKKIKKIKDEFILSKEQIELAKEIAKNTFCNIFEVLKLMLPAGTTSKKNMNSKNYKGVFLSKDLDEIEFEIETGKLTNPKYIKIINILKQTQGISIPELMEITSSSRSNINTLIKNGYLELEEIEVERNPFQNLNIKESKPLNLNQEQQNAVSKILESKDEYKEFLIYGVTGSGKTEVYMQIIDKIITTDKTALVLVPEISLTPQMIERFSRKIWKYSCSFA